MRFTILFASPRKDGSTAALLASFLDECARLGVEGLKRWCRHGGLDYLGGLCRRDMGRDVPFLDREKEEAARDFARALRLSLREGEP